LATGVDDGCMNHVIVPTGEQHLRGVYDVFDAVAREERFLASTEAPPFEATHAFFKGMLDAGSPMFVALSGEQVVGWCDVSTPRPRSQKHIGQLGMGLLPAARGQGLGTRLMQAAIDKAWQNGLTRIELSLRDDNAVARGLYEKFGFQVEGTQRQASLIRGRVNDVVLMGLLRSDVT
jgi:putative acetyltransferase